MSEQIHSSVDAGADAGDFRIEIPTKSREGSRYIIFVGDLIPSAVKSRNPDWRLGGKISPIAALRHRGGFIQRCEIVELRQNMVAELASMVHPEQRQHRVPAYTMVENGKSVVVGGDGLLRTPFYPSDQIDRLTGQVDGVVSVSAVTCKAEMDAAQRFLFPNWDDIIAGVAELPRKVSALRAHFGQRLAVAREAGNDLFVSVAQAALRSCDEYGTWGNILVTRQNAMYEEAKTKGWAWSYGTDADLAFELLGLQRRDSLAQEQTNRIDELIAANIQQADAMKQLFQAAAGGLVPPRVEVVPPDAAAEQPAPNQEPISPPAEEGPVTEETETVGDAGPASFSPGDLVAFADDSVAEVRGTKFGKLQVVFPDGTAKQVERTAVRRVAN